MKSIRVGDTVQTTDGDRRIVGYNGSQLKLFDQSNHHYEIVDLASFPALIAEPLTEIQISAREIDLVAPQLRDAALLKEMHVLEVLEGTPLPGRTANQDYDPRTTSQSDRKIRKAKELNVSESTIDNWISRWRKAGASALIDRRQARPAGAIHASADMITTIKSVLNQQTEGPTLTFGHFYEILRAECASRGLLGELKSESTVRRQVGSLPQSQYIFKAATLRRTAANVPDRFFNSRAAYSPGAEVQIDSSPGDFEALDHLGRRTRLRLTAMICKATRSVLAVGGSMISAKGVDHAILLARALVPLQNRPHPDYANLLLDRIDAPWLEHLTSTEINRCVRNRPFIRPQRIIFDNGKDYRSDVFRAACEKFGISCTESAPYSPDDKALIERFWETVSRMFCQYVPGYAGNSVANRGKPVPDSDLLRIEELIALFDIWVAVVYQNHVHSGLIDPLEPRAPQTPNSIFMAFQQVGDAIPMALTRDDYIDILPTEFRTIQNDGIVIGYGRYDAPELTKLRRLPSLDGRHKNKWPIRWDPYDESAVWVKDPESDTWIECELRNGLRQEQPFAVRIRRESKRIARERGYLDDVEARRLTEAILADADQASRSRKDDDQRRKFALAERAATGVPDLHAAGESQSTAPEDQQATPRRSKTALIWDPDTE